MGFWNVPKKKKKIVTRLKTNALYELFTIQYIRDHASYRHTHGKTA